MKEIEIIENIVCNEFGIIRELIFLKTRSDFILLPRQTIIYLVDKYIDFGKKDALMARYGQKRANYYNCIKAVDGRRKYKAFEKRFCKIENSVKAGIKNIG